jgi:hypothetical protein
MPQAIQNAKQILVGGTVATTADNIGGPLFRANTGEIGIFTPAGVRITAAPATSGQKFVLALSRGANQAPLISDVIDGANVKIATVRDNVAATEQVEVVGYNGTSGSILDVATYAGELYILKIIFQDFMVGTDSERIKNAVYQSSISDTQADIAIGLVKSAERNFSREVKNSAGNPPVLVYPLCNNVGVQTGVAGVTVTGVKGTNAVTFGAGNGPDLVAGDYFRVGTATSSKVYKIVSSTRTLNTAGVITLDIPLQETVSLSGTTSEYIDAASGIAANWGVVVAGQEQNFDRVKSRYAKIRYDLQPNLSFGSTVKSVLTPAFEGVGSFEAVASLEDFLNTFRGEEFRMGEPFLYNYTAQHLASSATDYSLLSITWNHVTSGFQNSLSAKEILCAVPVGCFAFANSYVDASADAIDIIIAAIVGVSKIKGDSVATTLAITV